MVLWFLIHTFKYPVLHHLVTDAIKMSTTILFTETMSLDGDNIVNRRGATLQTLIH